LRVSFPKFSDERQIISGRPRFAEIAMRMISGSALRRAAEQRCRPPISSPPHNNVCLPFPSVSFPIPAVAYVRQLLLPMVLERFGAANCGRIVAKTFAMAIDEARPASSRRRTADRPRRERVMAFVSIHCAVTALFGTMAC
jgi:hypothetical protein